MDFFQELKTLIDSLQASQVDYALCGGVALAIHGVPRATHDIEPAWFRARDSSRSSLPPDDRRICSTSNASKRWLVVDMSLPAVSGRLRMVAQFLAKRGFVVKGVNMAPAAVLSRLRVMAARSTACFRLGTARLAPREMPPVT